MASLKMNIPHHLSQQEALSRIKGMLGKVKEEQKEKISNLQEDWTNETGKFKFTTQGFDLAGMIQVTANSIDIDATIPFAVSLFKGKIKDLIEKNAKALLD